MWRNNPFYRGHHTDSSSGNLAKIPASLRRAVTAHDQLFQQDEALTTQKKSKSMEFHESMMKIKNIFHRKSSLKQLSQTECDVKERRKSEIQDIIQRVESKSIEIEEKNALGEINNKSEPEVLVLIRRANLWNILFKRYFNFLCIYEEIEIDSNFETILHHIYRVREQQRFFLNKLSQLNDKLESSKSSQIIKTMQNEFSQFLDHNVNNDRPIEFYVKSEHSSEDEHSEAVEYQASPVYYSITSNEEVERTLRELKEENLRTMKELRMRKIENARNEPSTSFFKFLHSSKTSAVDVANTGSRVNMNCCPPPIASLTTHKKELMRKHMTISADMQHYAQGSIMRNEIPLNMLSLTAQISWLISEYLVRGSTTYKWANSLIPEVAKQSGNRECWMSVTHHLRRSTQILYDRKQCYCKSIEPFLNGDADVLQAREFLQQYFEKDGIDYTSLSSIYESYIHLCELCVMILELFKDLDLELKESIYMPLPEETLYLMEKSNRFKSILKWQFFQLIVNSFSGIRWTPIMISRHLECWCAYILHKESGYECNSLRDRFCLLQLAYFDRCVTELYQFVREILSNEGEMMTMISSKSGDSFNLKSRIDTLDKMLEENFLEKSLKNHAQRVIYAVALELDIPIDWRTRLEESRTELTTAWLKWRNILAEKIDFELPPDHIRTSKTFNKK